MYLLGVFGLGELDHALLYRDLDQVYLIMRAQFFQQS